MARPHSARTLNATLPILSRPAIVVRPRGRSDQNVRRARRAISLGGRIGAAAASPTEREEFSFVAAEGDEIPTTSEFCGIVVG
jgi:hypothetical protein